MIKRAIELNTENANYLDTYGWILFLEKKYDGFRILAIEGN